MKIFGFGFKISWIFQEFFLCFLVFFAAQDFMNALDAGEFICIISKYFGFANWRISHWVRRMHNAEVHHTALHFNEMPSCTEAVVMWCRVHFSAALQRNSCESSSSSSFWW